MQRDRDFSTTKISRRATTCGRAAGSRPSGKWGAGRVELVQIPTPDETNDNIVAYWVPDTPPAPRQPFDFEYRLLWQSETRRARRSRGSPQTRRGHGYMRKPDESLGFVIDFEGPALKKLSRRRRGRSRVHRRRQRRARREQRVSQRGHGRLARDAARQAPRRQEAGRAARVPAQWRTQRCRRRGATCFRRSSGDAPTRRSARYLDRLPHRRARRHDAAARGSQRWRRRVRDARATIAACGVAVRRAAAARAVRRRELRARPSAANDASCDGGRSPGLAGRPVDRDRPLCLECARA